MALFVAENNIPLVAMESTTFSSLLDAYQAKGKRFNRKHITTVSLPKCEKRMREYFISRLRGSSVCLVVDEMAKYSVSYFNFTLCGIILDHGCYKHFIVFWDSKILDNSTSSSIGKAISETTDELLSYGINVTSFAWDNCNAMKKAEEEIPGVKGSYIITGDRPYVEKDDASELLANLKAAVKETTGEEAVVGSFNGYTDTAVIAGTLMNHNCMSYGPGSLELAHKPNEYVPYEDVCRVEKVLSVLAENVLFS